ISPAAAKRPQEAAPKQKVPANYALISDDTLRDLLRSERASLKRLREKSRAESLTEETG
ncbi:3224_t:CDS:2, partial [Ambispora leptoticha]